MHAKKGSIGRFLAVVTVTLIALTYCLCARLDSELLHLCAFLIFLGIMLSAVCCRS